MSTFQWKVNRSHLDRKKKKLLPVEDHPLKSFVITQRMPRKLSRSQVSDESMEIGILKSDLPEREIMDPLTKLALQHADPLSNILKENVEMKMDTIDEQKLTPLKIWNNKKTSILGKYTTSNKISIVSSYLMDGDKIVVKNQNAVVDKVQHRLEQLDWCEETFQKKLELTQAEYIGRIDMLNKELVSAWNSEQRVKAVKIVIQCAKLLADTDVMSFYPSKFVLITEILDIFGHFVYDRLKHIAETKTGSTKNYILPENFTPDMISDSAKETCLNWFHKIASIRELVPRLYVELAIMRSYSFLSTKEGPDALFRITKMINGIGNPLVAIYARCYLCKIAQTLSNCSSSNSCVLENLQYIIENYHHLFNQGINAAIKREEISVHKYLDLFSPAIDFIMEIIVNDAPEDTLDKIFNHCLQKGKSTLILSTILSVFKPSYVTNRTVQFLEMISHCAQEGYPVCNLLCSLGQALGKYPPPTDQRKPILRNIGKYSNTFHDLDDYISFVEAWIPFIANNFKVREINTMLGDIISRITGRTDCDTYVNQFKNIVNIILQEVEDFEALFMVDNFLQFLDLFQQEIVKVEVCKMILTCCKNDAKIGDPMIVSSLSFLCSILHDSVDALTPDDELRQIGQVICNIIRRIDYGRDFEQQLNFYVEARGSFANIDSVLIELIQKTNSLMVKTRNIKQGFHSRKTADFVRACAAYCFITIPSISSSKTRLELYLLCGQVALYNQCLGQADACFRAAVNTIPEYQEEFIRDEQFLVFYIKKFLSTLLVTPDNPDLGVLNLLRSLLNILQKYEWDSNGTSLVTIYLSVLDVLSIMAQETLPYHVDKVESNDTLYGSDDKFIQEIDKICTIILTETLNQLKKMGTSRKQSLLALELFIHILTRCDLSVSTLQTLAFRLWQQSTKHGFVDKQMMENIKSSYKQEILKLGNTLFQYNEEEGLNQV